MRSGWQNLEVCQMEKLCLTRCSKKVGLQGLGFG